MSAEFSVAVFYERWMGPGDAVELAGVIHRGADAKSGEIQRITITEGDHTVYGITFK
jgi:hypothetical protein